MINMQLLYTKLVFLVLIAPIWCRAPVSSLQSGTLSNEDITSGYRLPNNTKPMRYDIFISTNIHDHTGQTDQFSFGGSVTITVNVTEPNTDTITVHVRQLTINRVKLSEVAETGSAVLIDDDSSFKIDSVFEFLIVESPSNLKFPGTYLLEIHYQGELRTDTGGFYRSYYKNAQGQTRWLATTQFESTDARHGFPCYDEPKIRAPIGLSMKHGSNYHAISNMPVMSTSTNGSYTTTKFQDTPSMQTYLLAFVVSDFERIDDSLNNQSVSAAPAAIANGDLSFALDAGVKILSIIQQYVGVEYGLPKMDQIAIPDFPPDAMENWGLVTYREDLLLYNRSSDPLNQQKRVSAMIAHEFGHQYFGDLVSPTWWSYVWLNEGFATFVEYLASDRAFPELRIQEMFNVDALQVAFQSDALDTTRPMNFYVERPDLIIGLFDDVAYRKAGSVLRQLQHALGDSVFRNGVRYYLTARKYNSATPDDLAAGLQKAVDESSSTNNSVNMKKIIDSWAIQKGFPMLQVSRNTDGEIKLTQSQYRLKTSVNNNKSLWYIPYNFATSQNADFETTAPLDWLSEESTVINPDKTINWTTSDWIVVNKQQTGYYRVNYDANLWQLITRELLQGDYTKIHHLNRAQLIDDSLNLARSSHVGYDVPLTLLQYLSKESEYIPWASANNGLAYLQRMLLESPKLDLFRKYLRNLVKPAFLNFGMINQRSESHFDKLTRNILSNLACSVGLEECIRHSQIELNKVVTNQIADIDPNLRSVLYCNALRQADRATYDFVLKRLQISPDPVERLLLINVLGCSQQAELLNLYLQTTLNESEELGYRQQERNWILNAVFVNGKVGLEVTIQFMRKHAADIDRLFRGGTFGGRMFENVVLPISRLITNSDQKEQLNELMAELIELNFLKSTTKSAAISNVEYNLMWVADTAPKIENWLEEHVS